MAAANGFAKFFSKLGSRASSGVSYGKAAGKNFLALSAVLGAGAGLVALDLTRESTGTKLSKNDFDPVPASRNPAELLAGGMPMPMAAEEFVPAPDHGPTDWRDRFGGVRGAEQQQVVVNATQPKLNIDQKSVQELTAPSQGTAL